jgi:sugar-specific transcriptional regulator TrmB
VLALEFTPPKVNERSQLLIQLGLTTNQAVIFIALTQSATPLTVREISRISKVTREKVYCILPSLQQKGLVEKILTNPSEYKAISMKGAIVALLEHKTKETAEIKRRAQEILQNPEEEKLEQNRDEETIVVCKKDIGYKKRVQAMRNASKSLDIVTLGFDLEQAWDFFSRIYQFVLNKGSKIRLILLQRIESEKVLLEMGKLMKEKPAFEFRYSGFTAESMSMYVIDKKQVTIATSTKTFPQNYSVMCSRVPVLVSLALGYFENMWDKSYCPVIRT